MKFVCSLFTLTLIATLLGCGSPEPSVVDASPQNSPAEEHGHEDHDHEGHDHGDGDHEEHEHPETFAEAVESIKEMGGEITAAFTSGKPDDAHGELHEIGHVIEALPELAEQAGLSEEQQAAVQESSQALMDAFGELDGMLHGGDDAEVDVDEVSKRVSAELEKLQATQ